MSTDGVHLFILPLGNEVKVSRRPCLDTSSFFSDRLHLKPGMRILDVGCGVGGPMTAMARYSGANFVGLTINAYQN